MATHLLLCLCRRNTEWGMHLLPSQAVCNTLLSRSSPRRREFCVLPLGPNPHSCLSVSQVAHLDSHRTPLLWVQQGGEARQLQHSQPLAHPDSSYFQKICLVHGFSYTIHTNTYLPSSQVYRGDPFLKACSTVSGTCMGWVWAWGSEIIVLFL